MKQFVWNVETIRAECQDHGLLSDPVQLLPKDECRRLFRLCGIEEQRISQSTADYALFKLLAECLPYLEGHPVQDYCKLLLENLFGMSEPLSLKNIDRIWQECATRFLLEPISIEEAFKRLSAQESIVSKQEMCVQPSELPCLRISNMPPLSPSLGDTWKTWTENAKHILDREEGDFFFCIPLKYRFFKPDLYHVEQILRSKVCSDVEEYLWIAQVLRFLCLECLSRNRKLILRFECEDAENINLLLSYLRDAVGFPHIIWTADAWEVREVLWEMQRIPHTLPIEFALYFKNALSKEKVKEDIIRIALRYPYGRLLLICDETDQGS